MKTLLVFLLMLVITVSNAQLSPKYKNNFTEGVRQSCYKTQRGGSVNVQVSDITLKQYCQCSAEYIANILNDKLVQDIENGNIQMNPAWGQLAQVYCQKNYANYKPF